MKSTIQTILKFLAKLILKRYQPDVIGITGSVGKTSTKEAISLVLKDSFRVRQNQGNYNNELGLPLSIIGKESPRKSVFGWLAVFLKALRLFIIKDKNYPEILVLEMGADKPRDISYLMTVIPRKLLRVGLVTAISPAHLESFRSVGGVLKEKKVLLESVRNNGWVIINQDDEYVLELKDKIKSKILSYGLVKEADIQAKEVKHSETGGISFKLVSKGKVMPVQLPEILARHLIYSVLAAIACAMTYDLNLVQVAETLRRFQPLPGRMRLLPGIKKTLLIDDSYNSSPLAATRAVETLAQVKCEAKRYAVLGDMLELGRYTEECHLEVGRQVAELGIDYLITVGERARDIARGARRKGMARDNIFEFSDTSEAGRFIQERLKPGDLILIKGSQGIRTEKITRELMAEPLKAESLLVRQSEEWLKR